MDKVSIYQVFTRLFGNTKSDVIFNGSREENGVGKFNDFTELALNEIKCLGISHIWYTGVIAHARCEGNPEIGIPGQNPKIVKGRAGSPYAITDYYDVNPDLAENANNRMDEFCELIDRTHKSGLKVLIDFVPNHVAREYKSIIKPDTSFGINDKNDLQFSTANDFYYLPNELLNLPSDSGTQLPNESIKSYAEYPAKVTGNDRFSANVDINDWYETIKLNYGIDYLNGGEKKFSPTPSVWDKMVDILCYWADKDIDGFRCDMVEMVPVEFWDYAIKKVKQQFPKIIFVAEVYNPALYESYIKKGGFDYLYDKVGLYDTLKEIIQGEKSTKAITHCWQNLNGFDANMLSFLENHDEQRIASHFFAGNPFKAIPAMLVLATINKGAVMTYFGQEVGEPAHGIAGYSGNDGRTTIFDYFNVPEHQKWMNNGLFNGEGLSVDQVKLRDAYKAILNFSISNPLVSKGDFYDLMWINSFEGAEKPEKIYAYLRYSNLGMLLFIVNFSNELNQQSIIKIPANLFTDRGKSIDDIITITGVLFEKRSYKATVSDVEQRGVWFNLSPNSGKVFCVACE